MGTAFRYAQQLPQHIDLSDIQASTADFFFFKLGLNCLHSRDWCTTILWLTLAHSYGTAQNNTIATTSVYRRAFLLSNWHQKTHTVLITVTWEQSFQALICSQFLQGRFKTSVLLCSHTLWYPEVFNTTATTSLSLQRCIPNADSKWISTSVWKALGIQVLDWVC